MAGEVSKKITSARVDRGLSQVEGFELTSSRSS
jgi:hypothetical protein